MTPPCFKWCIVAFTLRRAKPRIPEDRRQVIGCVRTIAKLLLSLLQLLLFSIATITVVIIMIVIIAIFIVIVITVIVIIVIVIIIVVYCC